MGAGNFLPSTSLVKDYKMVYVDLDFQENPYMYLRADVRSMLTNSFYKADRYALGDGLHVIAQSELLEVIIVDNEWSYAVVVRPRYNEQRISTMNLAYHHMGIVADLLFKRLSEHGYKLHVRTGPWTSGKYQPEAV